MSKLQVAGGFQRQTPSLHDNLELRESQAFVLKVDNLERVVRSRHDISQYNDSKYQDSKYQDTKYQDTDKQSFSLPVDLTDGEHYRISLSHPNANLTKLELRSEAGALVRSFHYDRQKILGPFRQYEKPESVTVTTENGYHLTDYEAGPALEIIANACSDVAATLLEQNQLLLERSKQLA